MQFNLHVRPIFLGLIILSGIPHLKALRGDEFLTTDGTTIYYKDWGNRNGSPIVFCHGLAQSSDVFDAQMLFFGRQGYRVVAHDRRGFGRSQQTWEGNDFDTYADDLRQLIEKLNLDYVTIVGYSWGGGEVARYLSRYGTSRISKVVFISVSLPHILQTDTNPNGVPQSIFDGLRLGLANAKPQFFKDYAALILGYNRPGVTVLQGFVDEIWREAMMGSIKAEFDGIKTLTDDYTDDLKAINKPTLVLHGDDDQLAPLNITGALVAKLIPGAVLKTQEPTETYDFCGGQIFRWMGYRNFCGSKNPLKIEKT